MTSLEDLKQFQERYQAAKGNPEELAKVQREAFDFIDKDGSGFIERTEMEQLFRGMIKMAMKAMGMNFEEMPEEMKAQIQG